MDFNPLYSPTSSAHGDSSSGATDDGRHSASRPVVDAVQTVNIRAHVPVTLELTNPNHSDWRMFFDSTLGKFGLDGHISSSTPLTERDSDWQKVDQCIVNWIFTTCSREVLQIIRQQRKTDAFSLWSAITNLFHDNKLQRAVFYEAEFRNLYQGDMSIHDYCAKLKVLADNLQDVGQPVSEPSQVLNMLRGLNPKYHHAISAITSRQPPHTFLSARSHLLMEELFDTQRAATIANHALFAGQKNTTPPSSTNSGSNSGGPRNIGVNGGPATNAGKGGKNSKKTGGKGGDQSQSGGSSGSGGGSQGGLPAMGWRPAFNPWTGMVQAWPMPFRAPGSGVLGPRPGFQPQQAMYTTAGPNEFYNSSVPTPASSTSTFDTQVLMASLNSAAVPPQSTSDWFVDSGASSHMSGINTPLPSVTPTTFPTSITVGNGARLPVTHTASCSIPTRQCNLLLRNILLSPDLVENLISVRKLTRDNLVSVEFDPFGFSIKDLHTRLAMLRCDSDGDLYPLHLQPSQALHAAVNPVDLWHQRLGHPGR
jgi:uncharacterized membrane protein YgcG